MQVKMTMILHMLYGPYSRTECHIHGMGTYEDMDGDLDTIKLKILNFP